MISGIIPARYASTRYPGKPLIDTLDEVVDGFTSGGARHCSGGRALGISLESGNQTLGLRELGRTGPRRRDQIRNA